MWLAEPQHAVYTWQTAKGRGGGGDTHPTVVNVERNTRND